MNWGGHYGAPFDFFDRGVQEDLGLVPDEQSPGHGYERDGDRCVVAGMMGIRDCTKRCGSIGRN